MYVEGTIAEQGLRDSSIHQKLKRRSVIKTVPANEYHRIMYMSCAVVVNQYQRTITRS